MVHPKERGQSGKIVSGARFHLFGCIFRYKIVHFLWLFTMCSHALGFCSIILYIRWALSSGWNNLGQRLFRRVGKVYILSYLLRSKKAKKSFIFSCLLMITSHERFTMETRWIIKSKSVQLSFQRSDIERKSIIYVLFCASVILVVASGVECNSQRCKYVTIA